MKKMMTLAVMMTIAISASAMTYTQARNEALFLSDKMAYELGLTAEQYADVYEINFDYFYSVGTWTDVTGANWTRRNMDLRYVLTAYQYDMYMAASYFYRPIGWSGNNFTFSIYSRYVDRNRFYMARPTTYVTYHGGNNRGTTSYYAGRTYKAVTPHKEPTRTTLHGTSRPKVSTGSVTSFNHGGATTGSRTTTPSRTQTTSRTGGSRSFGAHK